MDLVTGGIENYADMVLDKLKSAPSNCPGDMMQKLAVANRTEGLINRLASLRKCFGAVSKGSAWVTAGATVWSGCVRLGFAVDAAIWAAIEVTE